MLVKGKPRRRPRVGSHPAGRSRTARLLWALSAALLLLVPAAARAERRAEVRAILARLPDGSRETQAAWLFRRAQEEPDASVAFDVQSELIRRFPGPVADQARLWKIRFFMAGGDTAEARREYEAAKHLSSSGPEAAYWGVLLGHGRAAGQAATATALPPWDLMRAIATLGRGQGGSRGVRAALELEGAARRWGLMGPWLWRLASNDNAALHEAAQEVFAAPLGSMTAAPETSALRERLALRRGQPGTAIAAAPATAPGGGPPGAPGLAVQVGTFAEAEAARDLVRELAGYGFAAYEERLPADDGRVHFHVRIGRGCSRAAAESLGVALSQRLMLSYEIVAAASADQDTARSQPR